MARAKKSKITVKNTKQLNDKNNFSNDENIELANVGSLGSEVIVGSCNGTDIPVIPDAPPNTIPDEYFRLSEDGTYYIVGDNDSEEILYHISGDIVIPSEFNGLPVKEIGYRAFDNSAITSVVIPNSVTSIGYGAFYGCSALTSIVIPNSVTTIGSDAFSGCSSLTNVIIKGKPTVNSNAFSRTPKLEKIYVIDGKGYASTDTIDRKPIKILPSTPSVVVKEMNVETVIIE